MLAACFIAEAGLEVKQRSPFPATALLGYSNGAVSYLPPRSAYPAAGWSVPGRYGIPRRHFKDYGLPTVACSRRCSGRLRFAVEHPDLEERCGSRRPVDAVSCFLEVLFAGLIDIGELLRIAIYQREP